MRWACLLLLMAASACIGSRPNIRRSSTSATLMQKHAFHRPHPMTAPSNFPSMSKVLCSMFREQNCLAP